MHAYHVQDENDVIVMHYDGYKLCFEQLMDHGYTFLEAPLQYFFH